MLFVHFEGDPACLDPAPSENSIEKYQGGTDRKYQVCCTFNCYDDGIDIGTKPATHNQYRNIKCKN